MTKKYPRHLLEQLLNFILTHSQISGFEGAGHIAKHLRGRGVDKLDFVLDEGYFVLQNFVQGVDELVSV